MLTVEGVLALYHAGVSAIAELLTCTLECHSNVEARNSREFDGCIFHRGVLVADGSGGYHDIAGHNVKIDTAAGTDADEGVSTDSGELLHSNSGRRAADTRRANADLLSEEGTRVNIILSVHTHVYGVVEVCGDALAASGITGEKYVATYVTLGTMNVKLLFCILHNSVLFTLIFREAVLLHHRSCRS